MPHFLRIFTATVASIKTQCFEIAIKSSGDSGRLSYDC